MSAAQVPESELIEWARDPLAPNVLALNGYGLTITVKRGHLALTDGVGPDRRERRLSRIQRTIDRIVVIGQTGYISLPAIRWCTDTGIALIQLDTLGRVGFIASTHGRDDPRLRRAQAIAVYNGAALEAARELIVAKLQGQHDTLTRHRIGASDGLLKFVDLAESAGTLADLASSEAMGAVAYFQAWADTVQIRFARKHRDKVPDHWLQFRTRSSGIHPGPGARDASDPINALLNYGYALAETECTIALRALGLDPGLGVLHADVKNRDSLALDIIEPIRPIVDDLVLQLLRQRAFTSNDFVEQRDGECRLTPPITSELAGHLTAIRPHAAQWAETIGRILIDGGGDKLTLGTPLTRSQWATANGITAKPVGAWRTAASSCESCGVLLEGRQRTYCTGCWQARRKELGASNSAALNARLADLKAAGNDPRTSKAATLKRSAANSASNRARFDWTPTPEEDALTEEWFDTTIAPRLGQLSRREIQNALSVSDTAAAKIRTGRLRPHKRHWLALSTAVGAIA